MTVRPAARLRRWAGPPVGMEPLPPRKKWRAILVASLLLAVAFWSLMIGLVALATDDTDVPEPSGLNAGAAVAFGLALIPFVFVTLAFASEHPRAPGAVVRAMLLSVLVGVVVTGFVGDPVTGVVAGVGAGGVAALRRDVDDELRPRVVAVAVAVAQPGGVASSQWRRLPGGCWRRTGGPARRARVTASPRAWCCSACLDSSIRHARRR